MSDTAARAVPKPTPAVRVDELSAQIATRMTPGGRQALRDLASKEGLTLQQLGVFAWNLALHAYGRPSLPERD
jgi:hypothetical protein